jgi:phasin family protein
MYSTPEKVSAANKNNVESLMMLANTAFASVERLAALNLNTARTLLEDTVANTKTLLDAKDVHELVDIQTTLAQPSVEKIVAYSRSIYEIASQTHGELTRIFENQFAESSKTMTAALDEAVKNAPAGSDVAVVAVKSALAAANSAYDSMTKAARQVTEITEANLAAAANATIKAAGTTPKAKKAA